MLKDQHNLLERQSQTQGVGLLASLTKSYDLAKLQALLSHSEISNKKKMNNLKM